MRYTVCRFLCLYVVVCTITIVGAQEQLPQESSKKIIQATLHNNTPFPVIVDVTKKGTSVGYFGILVPANNTKTIISPELHWFDKIAMGGFLKEDNSSSVYTVDVLKHGLADYIYIHAPQTRETKGSVLEIEMINNKRITIYQEKDSDNLYIDVYDVFAKNV